MRPLNSGIVAAWVFIGLLAFGPDIALPAIPWLPIGVRPPFATDKLSVLIVEETDQRTTDADAVMHAVRRGVETASGRYRQLDKDQRDLSMDEPWVQDAWKVKGNNTPWIVGATPRSGVNAALPNQSADAIKLLSPLGVK